MAITKGAIALPSTFNVVVPLSIILKIPAINATPSKGSPADARVADRIMMAKPGTPAAPFDVNTIVTTSRIC
ncbi:hypothetical protein D9M71_698330 [compost metagenome]